jgi:hypothetical protein
MHCPSLLTKGIRIYHGPDPASTEMVQRSLGKNRHDQEVDASGRCGRPRKSLPGLNAVARRSSSDKRGDVASVAERRDSPESAIRRVRDISSGGTTRRVT